MYRNHRWKLARKAALKRDGGKCVKCGASGVPLEVNHISPLVGRGYGASCYQHLDNLESCCKPCHQKITNEQRKARKNEKP